MFMYRELATAVLPGMGLRNTLASWNRIVGRLADAPRRRKRATLS